MLENPAAIWKKHHMVLGFSFIKLFFLCSNIIYLEFYYFISFVSAGPEPMEPTHTQTHYSTYIAVKIKTSDRSEKKVSCPASVHPFCKHNLF